MMQLVYKPITTVNLPTAAATLLCSGSFSDAQKVSVNPLRPMGHICPTYIFNDCCFVIHVMAFTLLSSNYYKIELLIAYQFVGREILYRVGLGHEMLVIFKFSPTFIRYFYPRNNEGSMIFVISLVFFID